MEYWFRILAVVPFAVALGAAGHWLIGADMFRELVRDGDWDASAIGWGLVMAAVLAGEAALVVGSLILSAALATGRIHL